MNTCSYRHRQVGVLFGVLALIILGTGLLLAYTLSARHERHVWLLVGLPMGITFATLILFSILEITVDAQRLTWRFLPGFITKSVLLKDIQEAKPTHTSFLSGWGIHYTNRGWLYNVTGSEAVHVRMRNGKQFMLGSDEPAALAEAINRSRSSLPLA